MPDYNRRSSSWPEMGSLLSRYFQSASTGQSRQHLERTLKAPSHASKEERSSHADALSEEIAKLSVGTRFNHRTKPAAVVETHEPDDLDKYCERAWTNGDLDEVFVRGFDGIKITRKDLRTLQPRQWLNDEIINFYLSMIAYRSQRRRDLPSVYAFNSFFYPTLLSNGYDRVKRWTRKIDIFTYDILLIPIHLGNHWCLAVIDTEAKEIKYFDSLGGTNIQCLNTLRDYFEDEHLDKKGSELDLSGWTLECCDDVPQQNNGSDCGVFACCFAELLSRRRELRCTQHAISKYRRQMVYEILNKRLL